MRRLSHDEVNILNRIQTSIGEHIPTAIYARKSKEDKSQEALETQVSVCNAFLENNNQYFKLKKTYQEDNVSGMYIEGRDEFKKLIHAIEEGFIKAVIVSKWDRFSRSTKDLKNLRESFLKSGAIVLAIEDSGEMNAVANLQFEIMAAINQYYVHKIAEDTKSVLINITSKGQSGGGISNYGYEFNEYNKLVMNPIEAAVVAEIYDKFEMLASYDEIIEDFKARNITTRKGNAFTKSTLRDILTNVKYYGVYRYNRQDREQSSLIQKQFDEVWVEGGIDTPIVSKEQFDEVQRILSTRKKIQRNTEYLLTGVLECGYCKNRMTGSSQFNGKNSPRKKYYICSNHLPRNGKTCINIGIDGELIENQAKTIIKDTINEYLKQGRFDIRKFDQALNSKKRLKTSFNKSIDNLENSKSQVLDRLIDTNTKDSLKIELEKRIDDINIKINELIERLKAVDETIQSFELVTNMNSNLELEDNILYYSDSTTKQLIKAVINNIIITNDDVEITILEE
jgi:site-specific DNA recombinase